MTTWLPNRAVDRLRAFAATPEPGDDAGSKDPATSLREGDVVADRFEVRAPLGAGGMGLVYRARDRATGALVALKVARDPGADVTSRLTREAEALAELRHPGIVQYIAHGLSPSGQLYLAMEYVDGDSLATRLRGGPLSPEDCVTLALRVAEALGAAHHRGLVHRDVKPDNVLLVRGSVEAIKLLDFGLVRTFGEPSMLTGAGALLGTVAYMAPEQARGDVDVDARADVFSLGCVLFECLTGRPPFAGESLMAVLAKILVEDAPRPSELRPDVPEALDTLVARMLEKRREQRPRDAGAVAYDLASIQAGEPTVRDPSSAPTVVTAEPEHARMSVVLVGEAPTAPMQAASAKQVLSMRTLPPRVLEGWKSALGGAAVRIEPLVGGAAVVLVPHAGGPTEQAAHAASCALALHAIAPDVPIVVATARGRSLGDAIDRGVAVLRADAGKDAPPVRLDETTAGLVESTFLVASDADGLVLRGARAATARGEPELQPATRLGRYEIVRVIGRGGMGTVYEAIHPTLKKRVALKTLTLDAKDRGSALARFIREGEAAARIRHPNVVDVYDVGVEERVPFLVMELLEGEALADLLQREGRLSPADAAGLLLAVCAALAAAHDVGVVHRDLKPENVFLTRGPSGAREPKVLDFGISSITSEMDTPRLTTTGAVMGTPFYIPPEHARGERVSDARSDQFSLGVILYECLTGKLPFGGSSLFEVMYAITMRDPEPPSTLVRDIPPGLDEVVMRALAKDPAARFASVRDLARSLLPFASAREKLVWGAAFGATSERSSRPAPRSASARRGRALAIGLTAATLVIVAAALIITHYGGNDVGAPPRSAAARPLPEPDLQEPALAEPAPSPTAAATTAADAGPAAERVEARALRRRARARAAPSGPARTPPSSAPEERDDEPLQIGSHGAPIIPRSSGP